MDGWKCPDGWRVKGDDEFCEDGDCYSHDSSGHSLIGPDLIPVRKWIGQPVATALNCELGGGFIVTPIRERAPLDIDLPYLLKKSAACSPEIQSQIVALKAKFAEEVCKLIEADEARRKGGAA